MALAAVTQTEEEGYSPTRTLMYVAFVAAHPLLFGVREHTFPNHLRHPPHPLFFSWLPPLVFPLPPSPFALISAADRSRRPSRSILRGCEHRSLRGRGFATVYLGLGSNVGDRHSNLLRAYKGLREVCAAVRMMCKKVGQVCCRVMM